MSSFIYNKGKFYSFTEYCKLNEAIKPKVTEYGINDDTNNGEIYNHYGAYLTFFKENDLTFAIQFVPRNNNNYEVGFAASKVKEDFLYNIETFNAKRIGGGYALSIFSKVFYVMLEMFNYLNQQQININSVYFKGSDLILGKLYSNLMKNRFFIRELNKVGFEFKGKRGDDFTFERVEDE